MCTLYLQFCYNIAGGNKMAAIAKNNRINIRVSDDDKEMLELAARYSKQSLSSYIVDIVLKQAELDIKKNETITLNNEQRDLLLKILDNPPPPNEALKSLFK